MGSRIKSIFLGGRSSNNSNTSLKGARPYDSIVALDPPVKGSYPVAGNGPNVLEEIQRRRAKRQSVTSSIAAPPPNVPRRREDAIQRPRTAPHDGTPGGGHTRSKSVKSTRGRTLSGFSMKSPPSIFSSSTRNSIRPTVDRPPLPSNPNPDPPPIPRVSSPPRREIKTYVPTNGTTNVPPAFTPPFAQHNRNSSQASHKSYVDLLDAHSNIKRTREASLHRTKASGVRNYGEDVADRNIDAFGERSSLDPKLDLNSPEFSYLKSVYAPKKRLVRAEPYSRVGSALGHVLGTDGSDDTQPSRGQAARPRTNSMRSTTSARSGPRPASIYPPRIDSVSAAAVSYGNSRSRDDHHSTPSNGVLDRRGRATSPLSSSTVSISKESLAREHLSHQIVNSSRDLSTPPIPDRGRTRPVTVTTTATTANPPSSHKSNPPPVSLPDKVTHSRQSSSVTAKEASSSKTKRRSMSAASQSTVVPPSTNGGTRSRKGSASYSAFPGAPDHTQSASPPASNSQKQGLIVERASERPNIHGTVNLNNSVETDVTTKQLPAVIHEHVTPTCHEIRKEVITRQIQTQDVYHRILPVIETEILPTKHYVRGQDEKAFIEIPEFMVPKHTVTGRLDQNWHISKPGPNMLANRTQDCEIASRSSTDSAPDGPVIALARGEPRTRPRGNSKASSVKSVKREPVLSNKKEYVTKDGILKTEYVWRHHPVFETATGETQPVYIGAGIGDLSGENYYSDEDDELGAEFGAVRKSAKGEEELLFRDSGYGSGGMLPGLTEKSPVISNNSGVQLGRVVDDAELGEVKIASNVEGEATKASKRMRERRRSSAASKTN